ncbi:MAG: hypothetical protein IKZ88_05110 [Neisseriaceae bacterium]|nr:hypothetical protein [Neisseriaceae bacterium]
MKKLFLTVLMCSFLVSSCTTTTYTTYSTPEDKIISFATVNETTGDIKKGSLIMFGENLNYVISPALSARLVSILNAQLPNKYEFVSSDERTAFKMNKLGIRIKNNNEFATSFCLQYKVDKNNIDEQKKLVDLEFKQVWSDTYVSCMSVNGKVYARNPQQVLPVDYRFETPVQVGLGVPKKEFDKEGTKVLLTAPVTAPLFVAAGVVFVAPFILGMTILSGGKLE